MSDTTRVREITLRGDRLQQAREAAGMTRRELAQRIGMAHHVIWRAETGISDPSAFALALICYELDISANWLLDLSDEMRRQP